MKPGKSGLVAAKVLRITAAVLFSLYLICLIFLTFLSRRYGRGFFNNSVNMIPFRTILGYVQSSISQRIIMNNLLGNVAAFAPMGFLLPLVWSRLAGFKRMLVISMSASIIIEIGQYIFGVGAADIDDVILNTAGGILGYLLYSIFKKLPGRHPDKDEVNERT